MPRRCETSARCHPSGTLLAVLAAVSVLAGCSDPAQGLIRKVAARVTNAPWHELHGWKAADFFTDPQVIALCDAIAANDVARMKERIAAGADVNARGKDSMTPLLWAFVDNKPERSGSCSRPVRIPTWTSKATSASGRRSARENPSRRLGGSPRPICPRSPRTCAVVSCGGSAASKGGP